MGNLFSSTTRPTDDIASSSQDVAREVQTLSDTCKACRSVRDYEEVYPFCDRLGGDDCGDEYKEYKESPICENCGGGGGGLYASSSYDDGNRKCCPTRAALFPEMCRNGVYTDPAMLRRCAQGEKYETTEGDRGASEVTIGVSAALAGFLVGMVVGYAINEKRRKVQIEEV